MFQFSSVQFSHSVVSKSLWLHESQHTRPPCPSPAPGVYSNSCPLSRWCHPTISSSVIPFSSCPQSFPVSWSFPMNQFFTLGGQNIGDSGMASVLPMKIQGWFPLGLTSLISWLSKELSRVFSNTTIWKHPKKKKKIKYLQNYKTKIESYKNQYKCITGIGFVFIGGFLTYFLDLFSLVWNILFL